VCVGHADGLLVGQMPNGQVCICVGGGGHCAGLTVWHAPSGHVYPTWVGQIAHV
jgi:hypothetical protein